MTLRRIWVESLTAILFVAEFLTNVLRFVGLGRRYYRKNNRIDGQTVVITGANSGIGKETAYQLSKRGAKIVMCCRNDKLGNDAMAEIRLRNPKADLTLMLLDLSSLDSVKQFADKLKDNNQIQQVDILINNAGVMMCPKSKSKDNFELQFATNHLGHFLLTQRLLPLMSKSIDARIINVSSVHHVRGQIFFNDINFDQSDPTEAYCQSKMANVLFSSELAHQLQSQNKYSNVKTYSLNPGTINTNLTRHVYGVRKFIFNLIGVLFNLDIYSGTQTTLYCALEPSLRNRSGYYYSNCRQNNCIFRESTDPIAARKLWNISCQMVGIDSSQYFNN